MTDSEPWRERFARLRAERGGHPLEDLHYAARQRLEARGQRAVSLSLLQKRLAPSSDKAPTPDLLRTLAAAVDVEPETFDEYRLALARDSLDETIVGLPAALEQLSAIDGALSRSRSRRAVGREQSSPPRREEGRLERPNHGTA